MDEFQERIAVIALECIAPCGFVLAGGQSLQAHGIIERPSADVDLFTDQPDSNRFAAAVAAVENALVMGGLTVEVVQSERTFARLTVIEHDPEQKALLEMALDPRNFSPAMMSVGPVLDLRDAVANKMATVFGRAYPRDYIDLAAIMRSGRYSREELLRMAATADLGFNRTIFREELEAVDRFDDSEFAVYELDSDEINEVRTAMRDWAADLASGHDDPNAD